MGLLSSRPDMTSNVPKVANLIADNTLSWIARINPI